MAHERLGELLLRAKMIDQNGLTLAEEERQRWGGELGYHLVALGLITEQDLIRALSTLYKVPAIALDPQKVDPEVGRLVPQQICENHQLICFGLDKQHRSIDVAMADPSDAEGVEKVRIATRYNVRPHVTSTDAVKEAVQLVFRGHVALSWRELELGPGGAAESGGGPAQAPPSARTLTPLTSLAVATAAAPADRPTPRSPAVGQQPVPVAQPMPAVAPPQPTMAQPMPAAAAPQPAMPAIAQQRAARTQATIPPDAREVSQVVNLPQPPTQTIPPPSAGRTAPPTTTTHAAVDSAFLARRAAQKAATAAAPAAGEPGFHITMDVPPLEKQALAEQSIEQRLAAAENALARTRGKLRELVGTLAQLGVLRPNDLNKLLGD